MKYFDQEPGLTQGLNGRIAIDEESIKKVFFTFYSPLCMYGQSFLGDQMIAEDVVVELFANVWVKREDLEFPSVYALKAFLFKCMRNATLNKLRKIRMEAREGSDYLSLVNISDDEDSVARIRNEILDAIHEEIGNLSPKYRAVIQMTLDGSSDDVISEELGIAKSSVWVNRMRAIRVLRKRVGERVPAVGSVVVSVLGYFGIISI